MIKKIKSSLSEKILFTFLISLAVFTFGSFYLIKNKCLFVKELDLDELKISDPKNLAIMDVECGKVAIELYPQVSPKSVERFKYFVNSGNDKKEADNLRNHLREKGFNGAFVVAFLNGKRISTKEALNLQNKLIQNE